MPVWELVCLRASFSRVKREQCKHFHQEPIMFYGPACETFLEICQSKELRDYCHCDKFQILLRCHFVRQKHCDVICNEIRRIQQVVSITEGNGTSFFLLDSKTFYRTQILYYRVEQAGHLTRWCGRKSEDIDSLNRLFTVYKEDLTSFRHYVVELLTISVAFPLMPPLLILLAVILKCDYGNCYHY